jgi:hypothetical protein
MAHPIVEKLKTFGIRHGEKVGVAVVTALCLTMLAMAFSRPSIDITADQIASSTQQARQNIQEVQKDDNVVKTIQGQGIVQPNFVKVVDERKPGSADPARYQLSNVLSSPEPGAGLLRDQPELIRVSRVEAHPGRGSIRLVVLDSQGRVQYEEPEKTTTKPKAKRKRRSSSSGSGGQARMMMGGGYGTGSGQEETEREKTDRLKKEKADRDRLSKSLTAGATIPAPSKKEEEAAPVAASRDYKTELKGFRWVALTGVVDHKQLRDNYARALKVDFAAANPHYIHVDIERQYRLDDGEWSEWEQVDRPYIKDQILGLLYEAESENSPNGRPITKEEVRLEELVDPLPFLEVGYWVGVHHADLLNKESLEQPKTTVGGMGGMMRGSGGMMGMMGPRGGMSGGGGMMGSDGMSGGRAGMMMMGGSGGMMGSYGRMFGGGSIGQDDTNFSKSDSDKVMVRAIDFTIEPDTIYRYRIRLIVKNPNFKLDSVSPGVDHESEQLPGPWSEVAGPVVVPPDVETYVKGTPPADLRQRRPDLIEFNVVRWNPENGLTVVKPFYRAPGEVVGEPTSASVPVEVGDETKIQSRTIDFTSHRILVDTATSRTPSERLGLGFGGYTTPTLAVLLRPDGMIELRDEAGDLVGGQMNEMISIYNQTIKDAQSDEKQSSNLNPFGGGSGGMMGFD